jgi:glyoxylase-like metal-dependent hydrolase (beta-lactamase superfamily II)
MSTGPASNPFEVREISATELARQLEGGTDVQLLDVRAPMRLAGSGRIELGPEERFINIAGSQLMALPDPAQAGLDRQLPVVAICGHGNSSQVVAQHLQLRGYSVKSLAGGMAAWMNVVVPRPLAAPDGFDHLVQMDRVGKGALGYLLVSEDEALVIDPPRDFSAYEYGAAALGARIAGVADTHCHADYISGGPALAARLGVPYYLHAADSSYAFDGTPGKLNFTAVAGGDTIKVGSSPVRVWHNPGHTEGSVTYSAGAAAFTGDFIFVASVGRPDLADKTEEWTGTLFDSLSKAKASWPAETRILPAHYAGKGERQADRSVSGTLGSIVQSNEPLAISDPAQFREWVMTRLSAPPMAYRKIKAINVGLLEVDEHYASELEAGKNECAV